MCNIRSIQSRARRVKEKKSIPRTKLLLMGKVFVFFNLEEKFGIKSMQGLFNFGECREINSCNPPEK